MRTIRGLNNGKDDPCLARMAIHFPLVLANFGAGAASLKPVYDGLFKRVVLDKNFIQQRVSALSFEPFMRAILWQIAPHCQSVMVSGIDDHGILQRVLPFNFGAMQGKPVACRPGRAGHDSRTAITPFFARVYVRGNPLHLKQEDL